jgi:Kef-type K+ transport system membrane component KefB
MRRAAILAMLFVGMQLVLPLGTASGGSRSLLTFGFLILAAYTIGEIATTVRLPRIVGYLAAGMLFGPSALGFVSADVMTELSPVSRLAIALIAFLAGAELQWAEVRRRGGIILRIMSVELALQFVAIWVLLLLLARFVPFLQDASLTQRLVLGALFSAVAIVHSPAVTLALLSETGARGPVARTTLGIVLVADVVVVLVFSAILGIARALAPSPAAGTGGLSVGLLAWELGGAVLVGAVLGGAIALYMRFVKRELFMFAIVVAFFGAEIARLAHVETLLTLLVAGFVTENITRHGEALRHAMERSAAPVFVVFFALAGAGMALGEVAMLWPIVVPIALVRAGALWGGSALGARWARTGPAEARYVWMGLVSQAGVAIGLAAVVADAYPERGAQMQTLFLAVLTLNQTIGPILFRFALAKSGELGESPEPAEPPVTDTRPEPEPAR